MTDLDKARVWAERMGKIEGLMPGHRAAAEVIQSLPDHWVDAEKLREALEGCDKMTYPYEVIEHIEKTLFTTKLPTLADMAPEERKACKWMQCMIGDDTDDYCLLITVDTPCSRVIFQNGNSTIWNNDLITPLPDLPKLQWPAQEPRNPETPPAETLNNTSSDTPRNPRPEDVPAGEAWLVEYDGIRHVGTREKGAVTYLDWALARLDGTECVAARDREITLISRLVPETPSLPEGMRLADHEEYGRVVTSPWGDGDDDYKIFFLNKYARGGADYEYAHESLLTFLDGGQHV